MRWVYVTAVRLGRTGGQSTRILEFCRALAKTAEVVLLAPPADFPLPEGVRYIPVSLPARPPREVRFQMNVYRALRQLSGPPPDVVYVYAGAFNTGALAFARQAGSRSLLELNGLPYLEFGLEHPGARGVWLRAITYRLMALVDTRLADLVVTVTRQLAKAVRRHTRARTPILVSSNGVNPTQFQPRPAAEARAALGLPAAGPYVGFVGVFAAWQGLDILLQGLAQMAPAQPQVRLLLVGDGSQRPRLQQLVADLGLREQVHFTGAVPYETIPTAINACDLMVAPFPLNARNQRVGVSPLKVFEYLGCGRPVLGAAVPGMEFIQQEGLGALFTPGDPGDLAAQLDRLLSLPAAEREAIGRRARQVAVEKYAWEVIVGQIVQAVRPLYPVQARSVAGPQTLEDRG
jgi:glycosyltransferase involved in cell wall biosynthesis